MSDRPSSRAWGVYAAFAPLLCFGGIGASIALGIVGQLYVGLAALAVGIAAIPGVVVGG